MSVQIVIQGTIIDFPTSDEAPNWADAVVQFAQAVEAAIAVAIGPFDLAPQVLNIDAYNPGTNIDIINLTFSTTQVRAADIFYSVYRNTTTVTAVEQGIIHIVYDPSAPVNNKWNISQERTGDASISFNITDVGQVRFTTTSLAGLNHTARLTFSAKALQQEDI